MKPNYRKEVRILRSEGLTTTEIIEYFEATTNLDIEEINEILEIGAVKYQGPTKKKVFKSKSDPRKK